MDSRQSDFFFWNLTQSSHSSDLGIYVCSVTGVKHTTPCPRLISHRGIVSNFIHTWGQDREKGPQIYKAVKSYLLRYLGM